MKREGCQHGCVTLSTWKRCQLSFLKARNQMRRMAGWSSLITAGFCPKAKAVDMATANTPQSSPPLCLFTSTNSIDVEKQETSSK